MAEKAALPVGWRGPSPVSAHAPPLAPARNRPGRALPQRPPPDGKAFGAVAFAWLAEVFRFDRGLPLTSAAKRPAHVDASFHGFAAPA